MSKVKVKEEKIKNALLPDQNLVKFGCKSKFTIVDYA